MFLLCEYTMYESPVEITVIGYLILLAFPVAILYTLWRIFVPPPGLTGANMLSLDPEASGKNRSRFCWSGIPIWKPLVYVFLAVMTLIY